MFLLIVTCDECGKEYELDDKEDPSNYQCQCGEPFKVKLGTIPIEKPSKKEKETVDKNKKGSSWWDSTTRKGVFAIGLLFFILGIVGYDLTISWIGVLTGFIGLILFLTDSWIIYLLIYLLWLLGGITAFSDAHNIFGTIFSGFVVFDGLASIILVIVSKRKNVKGKLDI